MKSNQVVTFVSKVFINPDYQLEKVKISIKKM